MLWSAEAMEKVLVLSEDNPGSIACTTNVPEYFQGLSLSTDKGSTEKYTVAQCHLLQKNSQQKSCFGVVLSV